MTAKWIPLLLPTLFLTGCMMDTVRTGPTEHEARAIERNGAERANVDLRMNAGELRVSGGASNLMSADFTYNVASWKPDVQYRVSSGRGDLTVEQPKSSEAHLGNARNEWDLRLSNDIPTELSVHFGAGQARLDLGDLLLRNIIIEMGVGELKLDLRGNPRHDYDVKVSGGVGEATIYLPANVGLYATATGGIGGIKTQGLRQEGSHWINDAYQAAKVQVRVDVSGGVGAINLIAE